MQKMLKKESHKPVPPEDALLPSLIEILLQLFLWPLLQVVFVCNTESVWIVLPQINAPEIK